MPGVLKATFSSSTSESGSPSENEFWSSIEPGDKDYKYAAASYPEYNEKPLTEQLEPVAVCGMACRLPGDVSSPAGFWEMMLNQGSGQTPKVPRSRFNIDAHLHPNNDRPGSFNVQGGYFLNDSLKGFDPGLFGITPIEAVWMDPSQRKMLEVVYEAFESAGVTLSQVSGTRTACFVACFTADFQQMAFKEPSFRHSLAATGVDPGIISNRISHVFNLNGPSIVVNTACSSSVYALHNACNALRNNECSAAVVGGVNLVLTVDQHMNTAKLGVLSPTSTCHTFDASADGYGRADGVGAVYLKRLSDAIRDGDPVRGVIRSSATNSNGKVPAVGITHPNREGQADVIRHAYTRGGDLDPRLTGYFECHGTGTAVGDPLEVQAVSYAMNENRVDSEGPLIIGAVKPNIGHSEAASGLSALIKAILIVERGIIPPTKGVVNPSPAIKWDDWKVTVNTKPVAFPAHLPVKRVSVNSFGYGGTNAHMIIEGADSLIPMAQKNYIHRLSDKQNRNVKTPRSAFYRNRPFLLPFSAHDKATLKSNIDAHGEVVDRYTLLDLSYTLANRRSQLSSRAFAVASHANLDRVFNKQEGFRFAEKKRVPIIGFVFTGQGAQWARMGSELMTYYPSFLRSIRVLDRALEDLPDAPEWSLEDVLLEDAPKSRVSEAEFSQPLCTAIQVGLVQLLNQWGVQAVVTVGHSSGEIAASYAAGHISATEAIIVAYYRGKVVRDVNTNGSMLAVGLGSEAVQVYLHDMRDKVVVACHNSPGGVTLSGDADALEVIKDRLDADKVFARPVKTGGKAYHSHHMAPVGVKYETLIRKAKEHQPFDLPSTPPKTQMVSSVTNSLIAEDAVIDETYWSANLRSPVLFNQAVQTITKHPAFSNVDLLIEIGPHSALSGPIKQIKSELGLEKLQYLPTMIRGADSAAKILELAGELFLRDYPIDIGRVTTVEEALPGGKLHNTKGSLIVDLPTYQWNRKEFWSEARLSRELRAPTFMRHDILGSLLGGGSLAEPTWRNILRIRDVPWLKDHSLGGEAVFPAAGYFSMACEAITQLNEVSPNPVNIQGYVLRDVSIKNALVTPDNDAGIEVLFNMRPSVHNETDTQTEWWDFNVSSISEEGTRKDHMAGSISINSRKRGVAPKGTPKFPQRASGKSWNQALRDVGFDYGPTFQDMEDIRFDGKTYAATCKTAIKNKVGTMAGESRHALHPAAVDSCLQLLIVSIYAGRANAMPCGAVPVQVDEIAIFTPTNKQLETSIAGCYSWIDQRGLRSYRGGSQLVADDGELLMEISDMRCISYEAALPQRADEPLKSQPYGEMAWKLDIDRLQYATKIPNLSVPDLVELSLFKKPGSKVLEYGSHYTHDTLFRLEGASYTITEVADDNIANVEAMIKLSKNAKVQKLDLSDDPQSQGVTAGHYDVVIGPANLSGAQHVARLASLLAPGGRLLWESSIEPDLAALESAGITGIDFSISREGTTIFVTSLSVKASDAASEDILHEVQLVYRKEPTSTCQAVQKAFGSMGWHTTTSKLIDCKTTVGDRVVMLTDFEGPPLLSTLEEEELAAIQSICNTASSILWVTTGGLLTGNNPEHAMTAGLARVITSEQASLDLTTLDFDLDSTDDGQIPIVIARTAKEQNDKGFAHENETYIANNLTYISRLVPNIHVNGTYSKEEHKVTSAPYDPDSYLVGKVQSGKIVFEVDDRAGQPLDDNHVEVQVLYGGLNKEDIAAINGTDYITNFSQEIGGVVRAVGPQVTDLEVGDRVAGFNFDKFATYQRAPAKLLKKIEPDESMEEVVGVLMAYGTALYGMTSLAQVEAADTVLILQGTGLPGLAAIRISQIMGATPYVVVDSEAEAQHVMQQYRLPQSQVLANTPLVMEYVSEINGGSGADVVFSSGSSDAGLAREAWRHIARFGRFVDFGRKNVLKRSTLDTVPVHRGANYLSFDMLELCKWRPQTLSKVLTLTVDLFREGSIAAPKPVAIKNITELDDAVASFAGSFTAGKTIIEYKKSERYLNLLPHKPQLKLRADTTYLLVGCLGGLGRSLTSWMMKRGARHFAFLSRSGADATSAAALVRDIEAAGADVSVYRGDVTKATDVERAVQSVPSKHPIAGVVHAAMVLRDGLFNTMTYQNWEMSTSTKVRGAMNLHNAVKDIPLDFFVMTSSVSGTLGTPGQSNYAAANSFLDAIAKHRHSRDQPAVSIILPMVLGVGVVAENNEIEEALKRKGMYGIDEEHLLEAFETAMSIQDSADHLVVGLDPAMLQRSMAAAGTTDSFWTEDVRFSNLLSIMRSSGGDNGAGAGQSILASIKTAASLLEAINITNDHIVGKLGRMLMLEADQFDLENKSIGDHGLDSMIGAEFRNWIFKEFGMDVPFQQLLAPTLTIAKFSAQVCEGLGIQKEA
ncbi:MAG: hypothetical protein LQ338_001595 [Usnochroma carphineum]|nr:MAG: hypothetical protein LQ338_001595 [Usnochroma carphineum]